MALIIEDGSQVLSSNSYSTRAEYIAYAATVGITVADNADADEQLINAAIYISTKEPVLKGLKVDRDQSMSYPRSDLYIDGFYWGIDEIPKQAILTQLNLALDIKSGIDLYNPPQSKSTGVKRKKVDGAVEVEYAVKDAEKMARYSASMALLEALIDCVGLSIPLVRA